MKDDYDYKKACKEYDLALKKLCKCIEKRAKWKPKNVRTDNLFHQNMDRYDNLWAKSDLLYEEMSCFNEFNSARADVFAAMCNGYNMMLSQERWNASICEN